MAWIESKKKKHSSSILPIFNYGGITGLNPTFADDIIKFSQVGYSAWSVTNEKISKINSPNSAIQFHGFAIPKNTYSKLHIEVDVPEGSPGNYNLVHVGIKYNALANYLDEPDIYIPVTDCYEQKNCAGTTPWYRLARCYAEVDISEATNDFYFSVHGCDAAANIYKVWLE